MDFKKIAEKHLDYYGRCMGSTTLFYRRNGRWFDKNQCVVVNDEMIWYGDLDVLIESDRLQSLANEIQAIVKLYPEPWAWGERYKSFTPNYTFTPE